MEQIQKLPPPIRKELEKQLNELIRLIQEIRSPRFVGEGICELRIDYGPGYRVYFGQIGSTIVLLLCGGDKSTQRQDINKAIEYWRDYERRENANK